MIAHRQLSDFKQGFFPFFLIVIQEEFLQKKHGAEDSAGQILHSKPC